MPRAKDTKPQDAEAQEAAPKEAVQDAAAKNAAPKKAAAKKRTSSRASAGRTAAAKDGEGQLERPEPRTSLERVRQFFLSLIGRGRRFASASAMARALGLIGSQASTLYKFLHGAEPRIGVVLDWLEKLGVRLQYPEGSTNFSEVELLPVFNGLAGAGAYIPGPGDADCDHMRPFDRNFFLQNRINPNNCYLVDVCGDSMEPMFSDGSTLLVDTADDVKYSPIDGKIYVVRYGDSVMAKRLKISADSVTLCSENPLHKPIVIQLDELDDFEILGRVRWYTVNI